MRQGYRERMDEYGAKRDSVEVKRLRRLVIYEYVVFNRL